MEEVEILNVGGDGVASEVTLQRLAVVLETIAKAQGIDPKKIQKELDKLAQTTRDNIEFIDENTRALEEHTDAVEDSESAFRNLGRGLLGVFAAGLGSVVDSLTGLTKTLMGSSKNLSDFAQHIPIIGNHLSLLTGITDESYETFSTLAKTGATFGYSLSELRLSARELNMELAEFGGFVRDNSQMLAAFGGTVDAGIRATRNLEASMGDDLINRFQVLGLQTEEITEALAFQQYVDRAGRASRTQDEQAQALAAQSLTENMLIMAKLTGEDIQTQRDRLRQNQMDIAFQMERMKLGEKEKEQLDALMIQAAAAGPEAVNALKAEFLGMPAVTRELQIFQTLQEDVFRTLQRELGLILSGQQTTDEFNARTGERMADIIEAQIRSASENQTLLAAGSAGLSGIAQELAQQMGTSADRILQYMEYDEGEFRFARQKFLREFKPENYLPSADEVDPELSGMAAFRNAIDEARESITKNLINPFATNILGPALESFGTWMQAFTADETGTGSKFDSLLSGINELLSTVGPRLGEFIEGLATDPEQAISDLTRDIANFFRDAIFGTMVDLDPRDQEVSMHRQGGLIESLQEGFDALFSDEGVISSLTNGISNVTNGLVSGFSEFWNSSESNQLREDIRSMFKVITDEIILMISSYTPFFGGAAEEITRNRLESAAESGTLTPEQQDQRDEIIRVQNGIFQNSLEYIRQHGELQNAMQNQLNEAMDEIRPISTVDQMREYQAAIDRARQDYIDNQSEIFNEQIDAFNTMVHEYQNKVYTGTSGFLGIGAKTPEEEKEEDLENLRNFRAAILEGIQSELTDKVGPDPKIITLLENMLSLNKGTNGFEDFGSGTLAMLHGNEAVIPKNSPLGKVIDNFLKMPDSVLGSLSKDIPSSVIDALSGNIPNPVLNLPFSNLSDSVIDALSRNIPEYNKGTDGFEDFGSGTLAMLHGREAVIPKNSPLGKVIDNLLGMPNSVITGLSKDIPSSVIDALSENIPKNVLDLLSKDIPSSVIDALSGNIPEYNTGTDGFEDFGRGTLALLHGKEAIIPKNSSLGEALSNPVDMSNDINYNESNMSELITKLDRFIESARNNASERRSLQIMQELSQTMTKVLSILELQYDVEKKTHRTVRGLGTNVLRGSPSGR